ncbi:MAG: HEPN domain-containing protein [Candidatus Hydrothermarchaeales archaeon]
MAEEKVAAAKHLCSIGYYRDAVSRAYYCMYHAAKAYFVSDPSLTVRT